MHTPGRLDMASTVRILSSEVEHINKLQTNVAAVRRMCANSSPECIDKLQTNVAAVRCAYVRFRRRTVFMAQK
eukprot:2406411-Rhodomonas_salina.2